MSDLLGVSFDTLASPALTLGSHAEGSASGWGCVWYPSDDRGAARVSDPTAVGRPPSESLIKDWERLRSSTVVCHVRGQRSRIGPQDAQPFVKAYAGRDWVFAHQGDLSRDWRRELALPEGSFFEPTGTTDSEHAFCWLLERARSERARDLGQWDWRALHAQLLRVARLGEANILLSDGRTLIAFHGSDESGALYWSRRTPPHASLRLEGETLALDVSSPLDAWRTHVLFSTQSLLGAHWMPFEPGQLVAVRRGQVVWNSHPASLQDAVSSRREAAAQQAAVSRAASPAQTTPTHGLEPATQTLEVSHETVYRYASPVNRSTHRFHLEPVDDNRQRLLSHSLEISVAGRRRDYDDVFGNRTHLLDVVEPFVELRIVSRSRVSIEAPGSEALLSPERRTQIPLLWMPWQRQMMNPYLLPRELPETQLRELSDFAMSFVERNDYDLLATLMDLNRTIYRDFTYLPGSTTIETTPFEVYAARRGVCQDFTNLFITLARLLNVPARYRMGYIYTGAGYENRIQSEASHAWVEIYLPWTGWCGFDPTNGCLAGADHVRVACGRHFWDVTPTSGTIYQGGGGETLEVRVEVKAISNEIVR